MELSSPIKVSEHSYTTTIQRESHLLFTFPSRETGTHVTPPDTLPSYQTFLHELATLYQLFSKKWFQTDVPPPVFMKRISHIWRFEPHPPYTGQVSETEGPPVYITQTWCPEQLHILPRTIQLHWQLVSVRYDLGQPSGALLPVSLDHVGGTASEMGDTSFEALKLEPSERARAIRKVREARIRAAAAKWQVAQLVQRYYERYGNREFQDDDSILSSDEDVAAAPPVERP